MFGKGSCFGKRFWLAFPLWVFLALPLPAATVSFLVIETGLREEGGNSGYSALWENSLLNVFFEAGHIVSNAPPMRLSRIPAEDFPQEALADFTEAAEGGAEFFILAQLDYRPSQTGAEPAPRNIALRVYRTRPYGLVHEERLEDLGAAAARDESARANQTVRRLIPYIKD
ncbi:MAG: hypothetical protein LBR93_10590 [Treponema sp.]|nr:hypothetical protein [Treponema sp.]